MTNLYTNGQFNRSAIMRRAWEILSLMHSPSMHSMYLSKYRSETMRQMLKRAWAEARQQRDNAQIAPEVKAQRIASLEGQIADLIYLPLGMNASSRRAKLQDQINQLAA